MAGRALVNARVHTMHDPDRTDQAIAWDGDTIVAVGDDADVRAIAHAEGWQVDDLDGRVVIPGFIDSHMHFLHVGVKRTRPDLRPATSKQDAFRRVIDWLEAHPGDGPVTGEGWDEADWPDDDRPTRQELDDLAGERPLVLRRICGHVAVANSAALPAIQERWDDDRVDADSGLLLEEPSLYLNEVLPADDESLDVAVDVACRIAQALGVTAVGDYEQAPFRRALLRAAADGRLGVRVQCSIYVQQLEDAIAEGFRTGRPVRRSHSSEDHEQGMENALAELEGAGVKRGMSGLGVVASAMGAVDAPASPSGAVSIDPDSMLRDGGLKVFLDGSLGGHTALMLDPYDDRPDTRGRAIWNDDEVEQIFRRAHEHGIQIHAHAIGDGAIEQGLTTYEALAAGPSPTGRLGVAPFPEAPTAQQAAIGGSQGAGRDERSASPPGQDGSDPTAPGPSVLAHRFEHYEIAHNEQVHRTAKLGIWASSQPNFVGEWSSKGGMYEERIGERFHLNNRFRTFLGTDLPLCFGSDGMPFGPLYGIQSAVAHPVTEERLSAAQAVYHYTAAGAEAMGRHDIGVLEAGRKADVLILDVEDLEARPPQEWVIIETIVGGDTMHRGDRPFVSDDDVE